MSNSDPSNQPPLLPPPFILPFDGRNGFAFWPQEEIEETNRPSINDDNYKNIINNNNNNYRDLTKIFYKTRLCARFELGTCPYGDTCCFAHGRQDLRSPPPNWQEILTAAERSGREAPRFPPTAPMRPNINNQKICRKFYNTGTCPYGEKCKFVHRNPGSSSALNDGSAIIVGGGGGGTANSAADNTTSEVVLAGFDSSGGGGGRISEAKVLAGPDGSATPRPSLWKTRICAQWDSTGYCIFGEKCSFAHGHGDLKRGGVAQVDSGIRSHGGFPTRDAGLLQGTSAHLPEVEMNKGATKWKAKRKLNGIYADWLDTSLLQS